MSAVTTWDDLLQPGKATDFFARREFPPFDPEAKSVYSRVNALWLAELSRLVYRHDIEEEDPPPQPTRASFLESAGLRQSRFFISTNARAILVESVTAPLFAVLVFRGTERILMTSSPILNSEYLHWIKILWACIKVSGKRSTPSGITSKKRLPHLTVRFSTQGTAWARHSSRLRRYAAHLRPSIHLPRRALEMKRLPLHSAPCLFSGLLMTRMH